MLCKYFTDMGRCPLVDCKFAHGEADLAQRKYEFECASSDFWLASMNPPNPSWLECHCPATLLRPFGSVMQTIKRASSANNTDFRSVQAMTAALHAYNLV